MKFICAAIAVVFACALGAMSRPVHVPDSCDRACLHKTLDTYLGAVAKHDPGGAPLAENFRETENAKEVKAGEGIWKTAAGLGAVQRRYFDPVSGQAAYFGLVDEEGSEEPALVGMRIKVVKHKITEAEWFIARKGSPLYSPEGLAKNPPREDTPLPVAEQLSRDELLKVGSSYFAGLNVHDGNVVIATDDCMRVENGTRTTGIIRKPSAGGPRLPDGNIFKVCQSGFDRLTKAVEKVVEQRFPVVDTVNGVVMGVAIFHAADDMKTRDGKPFPTLAFTEFFSTRGGKIATVHAAMTYLPPGSPEKTGW